MFEVVDHNGRVAPTLCTRMHPDGVKPIYMSWQAYPAEIESSEWDSEEGGLVILATQTDIITTIDEVEYTKVNAVIVRGPVPDGRYTLTNRVKFVGQAAVVPRSVNVIVSSRI